LSGCVGHYQQPAPAAAHATLDAKWGNNNLMNGGVQAYYAFYDSHCLDTEETGVLGAISASKPEVNQFFVKPNRRIYLHAFSSGIVNRKTTDEPVFSRSCLSIGSFIPQAGTTYQISHSAPDSGCSLKVIDNKTGIAPDTYIVEPVTKECGLN
jgi:hypothetical protein